jgi:putative inorganic carbon (hco3(-)) transporter
VTPEGVGLGRSWLGALAPVWLLAAVFCLVGLPLPWAGLGVGIMAAAWGGRWFQPGRTPQTDVPGKHGDFAGQGGLRRSQAGQGGLRRSLLGRTPQTDVPGKHRDFAGQGGRRQSLGVVVWPLLGLLLTVPLTLYATSFPELTWRGLAYLAAGIFTFVTLAAWADRRERLWLAAVGLVGVGLLLAAAAPFVVRWSPSSVKVAIPVHMYDFMSLRAPDAVNGNVLAGTLVLLLPLPAAWLLLGRGELPETLPPWLRRRWLWRLLALAAVLAMGAVLALTKCRGAYIATGLAMLALLAAWRWWAGLGALLLLEGVALAWVRMGAAALLEWLAFTGSIRTWEVRWQVWQQALRMLGDFPLTGVGLNTFPQTADLVYGRQWVGTGVTHAHNLWLQVGVDLGVIGLLAYTALWIMCLVSAWRAFGQLRRERPGLAAVAAGLGAGLLAMGVHGLVDAVTWAVLGLAWAVGRMILVQESQATEDSGPERLG